MPDLASRTEHEDELAAAIALLVRRHEGQWSNNFEAAALAKELSEELTVSLGLVFQSSAAAAAAEMSFALDARGPAQAWSSTYGMILGRYVADRMTTADVSVADAGDPKRWAAMAATEVTRAATAGSEFVAAAVVATRNVETIWHTEPGACPVCDPLDGQPREVWQAYAGLGPPMHPNCRCYLTYALN